MDAAVKKRTPFRASFTKYYKALMSLLEMQNADFKDVEVKFAALERTYNNLKIIDDEIMQLLLEEDSDNYCSEYETIESYAENFDNANVSFKHFSEKLIAQQNFVSLNTECTKLKLPKIELMKFGGEVKDWLSFWSQFGRIHEDKQLEPVDKFQYLIQCMSPGTRAKEIVDSYPPTADNYFKAVESLKSRFGREELLIEFYVRELLSLVVKNATSVKSKVDIVKLYDKLESHLRSLESIGMTSDKYAAMLFPLVESCIPEDVLRVWLRNPLLNEDKSYNNRLSQLLLFLKAEVEGEERISLAKTGIKQSESITRKKIRDSEYSIPTANDLVIGEKKAACLFCDKSHQSKDCYKAQKMPLAERIETVKNKKGCFCCLKIGHRSKFCRTNVRCLCCSKKHYVILCPDVKQTSKESLQDQTEEVSSSLSYTCNSGEVLLQSLLVEIEGSGRRRIVRALIDTGSQCSYILKSTANELRLKSSLTQTMTHVVFGGATTCVEHKRYKIKVRNLNSNYSCEIQVLDQPIICGTIPRLSRGHWIKELEEKGIIVTDVGQNKPAIELLIGADFAGNIYSGRIEKLISGLVAIETTLGWILMGKTHSNVQSKSSNAIVSSLLSINSITDLWRLEAIGISESCEDKTSAEIEKTVLEHFEETVHRNQEGRYEISLPWIRDREEIFDNQDDVITRLKSTTTKLNTSGKFEDYHAVFEKWINDGIIEELSASKSSSKGHYLPHRGVFKENSTTAVRPVFDASFRTRGRPSLNDCLAKGPNLLELIPSVLLKFREKRFGVISDIKAAFLQISVREEDRDCLRFLWWRDKQQKEVKIFRHCRVVFGVNCSPFLLAAVMDFHLRHCNEDKEIVDKLRSSFYVDNCVTSVDSEEELYAFIQKATTIMAEAKFELRCWEHSHFYQIPRESEPTKVLGLLWDKVEDSLFCDIKNISLGDLPVTRRNVLSIAQRVFDPIGFSCPSTLLPKLLLQKSWKAKLTWDAELPEEEKKKFLKWMRDLPLLSTLHIPRMATLDGAHLYTLHIFCDASLSSYATVIFLRSSDEAKTEIQLLQAKSRVSPLHKITIPRLELLACLIGARLTSFVKKNLGIKIDKEYYWTDSSTALYWIQHDDPWNVFVKNRVEEIRKLSDVNDWRHVPGISNPADLPSRGCSVKKMIESRWWEGPEWLRKDEEEWPLSQPSFNEDILMEKKITAASLVDGTSDAWLLSYFSSYKKIVRMVAWIQRFLHNISRPKPERLQGELTVKEIDKAERKIISIVQAESFAEDYLKHLNISFFKDESGLLRVKTKLTERDDLYDFKTPILLPSQHRLVRLLIHEQHVTNLHCGSNSLLLHLREKYWIINAKKTVRKVISQCVRCRRHEAKSLSTPPVPLPEDRVRDASVFEIVGVDLAGPLTLRGGEKSWIVLYSCAVFRAVHLELIQSLSTEAFLLSFRRYLARRGRPKIVYSDNGTNFVGSYNLLKAFDAKLIQREASVKGIDWKFNPPSAPWWGGFYERFVQVVKKLLRRVLGNACLSYEELMTLLCDSESVINSRPLTYISENSADLLPITPAMFLQDIQTVGVPDLDHLDKISLSKRLRYLQKLRGDLRKRFRSEYLGQLILSKSKDNCRSLEIGEIVLVEKEGIKRTFWPMGRIISTFPGKDGKIRLAKVKTSTGEFLRPVQRLIPLEVKSSTGRVEEVESGSADSHYVGEQCLEVNSNENEPEISLQKKLQKLATTKCGRERKLPSKLIDYEL